MLWNNPSERTKTPLFFFADMSPNIKKGTVNPMKKNFITFEGVSTHYLKPLGEAVCIGAYSCGDEINKILADGYVDVFSGELFGKSGDSIYGAMPTYSQTWKTSERKQNKKARRRSRIKDMCGIHWNQEGLKVQGASRKFRRRMMPNAAMQAEFDGYLPF